MVAGGSLGAAAAFPGIATTDTTGAGKGRIYSGGRPPRPAATRARRPQAPDRVHLRLDPGHLLRAPLRPSPDRGRAASRDPGSMDATAEHHLAPDAAKPARPPLHQPESRARHHRDLTRQDHRRRSPPATTPAASHSWEPPSIAGVNGGVNRAESRPPTTVPIPPTSGPGHTDVTGHDNCHHGTALSRAVARSGHGCDRDRYLASGDRRLAPVLAGR